MLSPEGDLGKLDFDFVVKISWIPEYQLHPIKAKFQFHYGSGEKSGQIQANYDYHLTNSYLLHSSESSLRHSSVLVHESQYNFPSWNS